MTSHMRPDVVATQIRIMRDALTAARAAVQAWEQHDEESRYELAEGMLLLLGEPVEDRDGELTLQIVSDFFEEHAQHLDRLADLRSDKTSLLLLAAVAQLAVEAKLVSRLTAPIPMGVCIVCNEPTPTYCLHDDGVCFECRNPDVEPGMQVNPRRA